MSVRYPPFLISKTILHSFCESGAGSLQTTFPRILCQTSCCLGPMVISDRRCSKVEGRRVASCFQFWQQEQTGMAPASHIFWHSRIQPLSVVPSVTALLSLSGRSSGAGCHLPICLNISSKQLSSTQLKYQPCRCPSPSHY